MFSLNAFAHSAPTHVFVVPQCLLKQINAYTTLGSYKNLFLIKTDIKGLQELVIAKKSTKELCGGFIDVTDEWQQSTKSAGINKAKALLQQYDMPLTTSSASAHYTIKYETKVNPLLQQIIAQNMWDNLTTLSNFHDRFAFSENGVKAAHWIKEQIETLAKTTEHHDVEVFLIDTGRYRQPSVVAKFGNSDQPGVVIGGHLDSIVGDFYSRSPGADDDGSGTVTVMEIARTILSSGMRFKKPIYFIWYAAEEEGLFGSKAVVAEFKKKEIPIDAVLQLDLTGYTPKNDPTLWLISDYVNADLTAYLEKLIKTYVKQPVKYTKCGYACSDHASWHKAGFTASMPVETEFGKEDPYIHTSDDTMDILSLNHMADFVKLGVAFAVEMAEPIN